MCIIWGTSLDKRRQTKIKFAAIIKELLDVSRNIALCYVNSFTEATEFQLCVCFPCKQQVFRICKSLGAIESNDVRVQEEINICKRDERTKTRSDADLKFKMSTEVNVYWDK